MAGRWFLVEWGDGSRGVVNIRAVVGAGKEFQPGDEVTVAHRCGGSKQAKLIAISDERQNLELQLTKVEYQQEGGADASELPGPSLYEDPEPADFSPSGSSWGPDHSNNSGSDSEAEEVDQKQIKPSKRQYTNKGTKKSLTPSLRPQPIVPKSRTILPQNMKARKNASRQSIPAPQSTSNTNGIQSYQSQTKTSVTVSAEELTKVKRDLKEFKEMLKLLKNTVGRIKSAVLSTDYLYESIYACVPKPDTKPGAIEIEIGTEEQTEPVNESREDNQHPEVKQIKYGLIKHNPGKRKANKEANCTKSETTPKVYKSKKNRGKNIFNTSGSANSVNSNEEMVPIGSGNTFVPKRVYERINWSAYTMATRKLLMAVFPRKILASHSLTGKASPAFTNKPAKLCLDPKKVFDIVITVTKNCNVKESLVRSAITTKCADEFKMMRMKSNKEKGKNRKRQTITPPFRILSNQVIVPANNIEDRPSRSVYNQSV